MLERRSKSSSWMLVYLRQKQQFRVGFLNKRYDRFWYMPLFISVSMLDMPA